MNFKALVERIQAKSKEGRELNYTEGAIGITALLHCPLKWELSQKYDIETSAVEIDDGFVWEKQVKESLRELYGEAFKEEFDLITEIGEYKLHGHLDCFVEDGNTVIGIELKAPKTLLFKEPYTDKETIFYDDGRVVHNDIYLTQAKIEKLLLKKLFPEKEVKVYLFYKALCKSGTWSRKLYVVSEVRDEITEEELLRLVERFHTNKSPRYPNECTQYCEFYRQGLCEGKEFREEQEVADKELYDLIKHYRALESDLRMLSAQLKRKLKGSIVIGGKELGWIRRKTIEVDKDKLMELLNKEELKNYLVVDWRKKDELIERFGNHIVKEVKEILEWRF